MPELIENYNDALNDLKRVWECHHRKESVYSRKELITRNEYYNVSPDELIFLTRKEHNKLHKTGNTNNLGKRWSDETKNKLSKSKKGKKRPAFSAEWLHNMSVAHLGKNKGYKHSEETRKKMSEAKKGKRWKLVDGKHVYFVTEVL